MRYNLSGKNRTAQKSCYIFPLAVLFCCCPISGRQLDLQRSHLGLPFAVFYNPSLINNNSGVSFGADARYADKKNHDVRAALTIPVAKTDGEKNDESDVDESWFTRNAGSAFSAAVLYDSYDNYQISTGFGAYIRYIRFGTSFDIVHYEKIENEDDKLGLGVDLALAANITERETVSFVFHNVLVDKRNEENWRGLTLGLGAALNPNLLLNTRFTGYIDRGKAKWAEGGASLNFFIPQFILKNSVDYSMNASAGFDIISNVERKTDNKFFMNIGVSLYKKPALTAALVGVNKNENYLAFLYNSNKKDYDNDFYADLKFVESDSGKLFFHLRCNSEKTESWILNLEDGGGKLIRTFSGGSVIPAIIEWDGLDHKGNIIKDTAVRAKLIVQNRRKSVRESETVIIKR